MLVAYDKSWWLDTLNINDSMCQKLMIKCVKNWWLNVSKIDDWMYQKLMIKCVES